MGVSRAYKLPWNKLDPGKIDVAATVIAASLPGVRPMTERHSTTVVRCHFVLSQEPGDVPLDWRSRPHFELLVTPNRSPAAFPIQVEVDFKYLPSVEDDPADLCLMSAEMGCCWNEPLWPLATGIMDHFCRHWGIEPEWW